MDQRIRGRWAALFAVCTLALVGGCSPGGPPAAAAPRAQNIITQVEVEESTATNAWDLVHQLRPNWLRGRGSPDLRGSRPDLPIIYVGTTRQGSVETLRAIPSMGIVNMRYLDGPTATTRYGNGHAGGVIEITIRRR